IKPLNFQTTPSIRQGRSILYKKSHLHLRPEIESLKLPFNSSTWIELTESPTQQVRIQLHPNPPLSESKSGIDLIIELPLLYSRQNRNYSGN
ncbi:hypothetical protein CEXT_799971, partial [Caerostris extrusa]